MEAGRNLFSSPIPFPSRTHLRNCSSSGASPVLMLHEHVAPTLSTPATMLLARYFPTSVVVQEQQDESQASSHLIKEDRISQESLDRLRKRIASSGNQETDAADLDQYVQDRVKSLHWPGLCYLFPSLNTKETLLGSMTEKSIPSKPDKFLDVEPHNVVSLAKEALVASKEAVLLAEESELFEASLHEPINTCTPSTNFTDAPVKEEITVRSTRRIEQARKRRTPKSNVIVTETHLPDTPKLRRKSTESHNENDPLRLFLSYPETKQLLTPKQESELIVKIQSLMKLEDVKSQLHRQFEREPTIVEWAEAAGLSCRALQSQLQTGNSSREKLIYANFRMVVHIAKQYQGRGLSLQDLLQEGSMGLMRSVGKFKPQAGCRFATYAYWWIRQAVRKAIFQHSRTIRLPENVYSLLTKVKDARTSCIQQGCRTPSKEDIAAFAGMSVEKLDKLLFTARMPLSLQQSIWADQDTTFQEVTADTTIEAPDVSVSKQLMRRHVRSLLHVLGPKERKIIRMRFGMEDGNLKSLSEIGNDFGLSKERVRQLESRALYKLKQCLGSQGLDAYSDLLV